MFHFMVCTARITETRNNPPALPCKAAPYSSTMDPVYLKNINMVKWLIFNQLSPPSIWSWQYLFSESLKCSNFLPAGGQCDAQDGLWGGLVKPASFISLVGDLQLWINQLDDPANHKRVKSDHWNYGRVELTRDACTCLAFLRTSFSPHSLHVSLATTTRNWQISSFKCNS